MNYFEKLEIKGWRQFEEVSIDLSSDLTVLTGKNGCGKTTILNVLGKHFGWNINFVSTPHYLKKKKGRFWSDVYEIMEQDYNFNQPTANIGSLLYSNGAQSNLTVPTDQKAINYNISIQNQQSVNGISIPSHRSVSTYHNIDSIPTNPQSNQQQFEEFQQLLIRTYGSGNYKNPGLILKKSLISLAVFGYGNQSVAANQEYIELFEGFQNILKKLLPEDLGFESIEIRMPDVVLKTKTGDFNIDAMSGGINALFSIGWQIFMYGANRENCTILMDEPENHLHPSMQRNFLPSIKKAFPSFKFIISTHSPFILGSFPDANVYALAHNNRNKVNSFLLSKKELSGNSDTILKEILGLNNTYPIWVEEKIKSILEQHFDGNYNKEKAEQAYNALVETGIIRSIGDSRI
ncbi:AAA family ATPase [Leptospira sp. WS39.C2]